MDLSGARTLVIGGTGVLGRALGLALHEAGARLVVTGRDEGRLAAAVDHAEETYTLDLLDLDGCRSVVTRATERLGGLDLVVVATGVAGFGSASETPDAVTEELFAVNTLGPIAVISQAAGTLGQGGALVVITAILADAPMAGMAPYSASKAALSAYLVALRREVRRAGVNVLDVRPPHMETGLAGRAVAGEAPKLPAGYDVDAFVRLVVEGIRSDARELVWDPVAKDLVRR